MAKRKKKNKYQDIRKMVTAGSWLALVMLVTFFVGRYFLSCKACNRDHDSGKVTSTCKGLDKVTLPKNIKNVTKQYKGFIIYFNPEYHIPNCVSYELTGAETEGDVPRFNSFATDPNIKGSANPWDYTRSGYDRGHMAPAADMKWDQQAMEESFYMTNVCPQIHALNDGGWQKLEKHVREWAERDSAIIVITGPILSADMATIGDICVAVPQAFFKVVLAPYTNPVRAIGFIYPNRSCKGGIKPYAVSVDEVEKQTGLDFFSALPDDVENKVESECNVNQWQQR